MLCKPAMAELRVLRSWLMSSASRQPSANAAAGACAAAA